MKIMKNIKSNNMIDHYYAIIMAGGGGTRLWPLSRQARPKQMLRLVEDRSLFQGAVDRLKGIFPDEHILVVTVRDQAKELQSQCPEIPVENFLIEPMPRGTASVIGLGATVLKQRDPQAIMAVLTSDHYIGNKDKYHQLLTAGFEVAQDDYLVTLGISPTYAATGYGYIQQGDFLNTYQNLNVYRTAQFIEKPNETQAMAMLAKGDHSWNSGMFIWKVEQILTEFSRQMPELAKALEEIGKAWGTLEQQNILDRYWSEIKTETIDYGVMEGAKNVAVIPAEKLDWSDVGSWDSLFDVLPVDHDGNIVIGGHHVGFDTQGSLVYVNQEHRLIVTIGIEDLIVVDTGDVLLVCQKKQAQKVRKVVEQLKKTGQEYI
jgi:mannose-1-phosphate guanylyltransferase